MKRLSGEQIFSLMSDIDPRLLAEAVPPSWVMADSSAPRREKRNYFAWLDSGWVAAILSTVVAIGVLVAIVMAGRMGTGDPVGGTRPDTESGEGTVTETTAQDRQLIFYDGYMIYYQSNGDGTCSAEIHSQVLYNDPRDVVVPLRSPAGDTVTELVDGFNLHTILPYAMLPEDFDQYIQMRMEQYFGITLEDAEAIKDSPDHLLYEQAFRLRKNLAFFSFRPAGTLENETLIDDSDFHEPVTFDVYLLDSTMDDAEKRALHDLLLEIGFNASEYETAFFNIAKRVAAPHTEYTVSTNHTWGIRTVTLPATLTTFPTKMFDRMIDLEYLIYEGTVAEWSALTGGEWEAFVEVRCSDGTVRVEGQLETVPDDTPREPSLTVSATNLYLETHGKRSAYIKGYVHWTNDYYDGYIVTADMVYPTREELVDKGLPYLTLPQGKAPTVIHEQREAYTYRLTASIYATDNIEGDRLYWLEASNDREFDTFATLPVGRYVVELSVIGTGPRTDEVGTHEGGCAVFTFQLHVLEPDGREPTLNSTTMSVVDKNGETVYIPGRMGSSAEVIRDGDNPPELLEENVMLVDISGMVHDEMVGVTWNAGVMPELRFEQTEGWTYKSFVHVYDARLSTAQTGDISMLGTLSPGQYYVEITVGGDGPYLPEFDGNEYYVTIFTFRLTVTEAAETLPSLGNGYYRLSVVESFSDPILYEQPAAQYRAGERVTIKVHMFTDTDIECFVNGQSIGRQTPVDGEDGYHWEYYFDMPAEDVTVTFREHGGLYLVESNE